LFAESLGSGYEIKTGVSISRQRRVSVPQRLYYSEIIRNFSGIEFEADIFFDRALTEDERELFEASLKSLVAIGGNKNHGMGFCTITLSEYDINKEKDEILNYLSPSSSIRIKLKTLSPMILGKAKGQDYFSSSQDYISGSAIRSALINKLKSDGIFKLNEENRISDRDFETMFLNEDTMLLFDNAYPSGTADQSGPVPLTAESCKKYPGFSGKSSEESSKPHGVIDNLLYDFILDRAYKKGFPFYLKRTCPICNSPIKKYSGYTGFNQGSPEGQSSKTRVMTKSAVNRMLNKSQDGMLYSIEAIEKGEVFRSKIRRVTAEFASMLKKYNDTELLIGGSKGRGFGRVSLEFEAPDKEEDLNRRVKDFNEKLRKLSEDFTSLYPDFKQIVDNISRKTFFSLTLYSDTFIYSPTMSPLLVITEEYLANLGIRVKLERSYKGFITVGGWNCLYGLPREKMLAISKGSVFLYSFDGENLDDKTYKFLLNIEQEGLGELKEEGFGRMKVCDSFHYAKEVF
ncbi:MAG: CRISPR-associated RAMP protein Csx10, partial [Candidatus Eremiobacterota bacterium]